MICYFCPYNLDEAADAAERANDPSIVVEIAADVIVHLTDENEAMLFALRFDQQPEQPNTFVVARSAELTRWLDDHCHSAEVHECTRVYFRTQASCDAFWATI